MSVIPSPLANCDFKHSLVSHLTYEQTILDITGVIKNLPSYESLKLDDELTLYVCRVVEHIIKKVHKIDKKVLVIKCLTEAFGLTPTEQLLVSRQIEFLWNNKKITKTSFRKAISRGVIGWVSKKLL